MGCSKNGDVSLSVGLAVFFVCLLKTTSPGDVEKKQHLNIPSRPGGLGLLLSSIREEGS